MIVVFAELDGGCSGPCVGNRCADAEARLLARWT